MKKPLPPKLGIINPIGLAARAGKTQHQMLDELVADMTRGCGIPIGGVTRPIMPYPVARTPQKRSSPYLNRLHARFVERLALAGKILPPSPS